MNDRLVRRCCRLVRNDVNFVTEISQCISDLTREVAHAALMRRVFTCDDADF